jgi:acyl-CoA reductase-like NAD-dependent aldehyde dehydrogenase
MTKSRSIKKKSLNVTSPYDGSLIRTIPLNDAVDAERMIDRAASLFADRDDWLEPHNRLEILQRLSSLVEGEAEEFSRLIAMEGGKPLLDARVEVARAVDGIRLAAKELSHIMRGEEIPMGHTAATSGRTAFTTYEPIGIVVAVSAFNHPLNLIVHQAVPAIAVGCPVIIKPAGTTPLTCLRFCEFMGLAGLPEGWCQPIVCDNEVAEKLVTGPRTAFFTFIGSARVGWMLRSKLSPGTRCALEHGGSAPVIVEESADIEHAIPSLLKGAFYHAGQVCVSVQRVFVPEEGAEDFAKRLSEGAEKLKVGDPSKEDTEVGPLILPREVDRVAEWVEEAVGLGANLLTGGKKLGNTTYAPTVLFDPPRDAKVSREEIFGPVVCVYPYKELGEAVEEANSLDVAFQASVYSSDIRNALDTVRRLDASAVMVNDHTAFRADWMPFAGRRASGLGIGGIGYTMHDMIQHKLTVIKTD